MDDVNTIAAYAQDMSEFLNESELTERRAFIETFVKEIVVMPGDALLRYTIPISQSTPKTQLLLGGRSEEFWVSNEAEASSQLVWDVERRLSPAGNWHHTIIMRLSPASSGNWHHTIIRFGSLWGAPVEIRFPDGSGP